MSFANLRAALEGRFATNWGSTAPVKWQNAPFNPPAASPWVAFWILDGHGAQKSLQSNPLHRFVGLVTVQVFTPEATGTNRGRELADTAAAIFRRAQFAVTGGGTVTCRTPSLKNLGLEAGWLQLNVETPYQYDVRF